MLIGGRAIEELNLDGAPRCEKAVALGVTFGGRSEEESVTECIHVQLSTTANPHTNLDPCRAPSPCCSRTRCSRYLFLSAFLIRACISSIVSSRIVIKHHLMNSSFAFSPPASIANFKLAQK